MSDAPIALIVTHRMALEVDGVIDLLRGRGISVIRWNLCQFPEDMPFSVTPSGLQWQSACANLNTPQVGWLHDIGSFSTSASLSDIERDISLRESQFFWDGLLESMDCRWLNSPSAIKKASLKLYQLKLAQELNIPIPDYIASSDPILVGDFIKQYESVIAKAVRGGFINYRGKSHKFLTKRITALPENFVSGIKYSPVIFQNEIEKLFEIRVTVVNDIAFATKFFFPPGEYISDIREIDYKKYKKNFSGTTEYPELIEWSKAISTALGIEYCGIDWIIDKQGKPFFLECNPLGSFKWHEITSGHDITSAICDRLIQLAYERSLECSR